MLNLRNITIEIVLRGFLTYSLLFFVVTSIFHFKASALNYSSMSSSIEHEISGNEVLYMTTRIICILIHQPSFFFLHVRFPKQHLRHACKTA